MHSTPNPDLPSESAHSSPRNLLHTVLLACAVFLIPVLIGTLFVLGIHKLTPRAAPPPADAAASLTNRLYDGSATNVSQLVALRRDLRNEGHAADDVNLRLWAAHAAEPEILFRVPPPDPGKNWNWYVSQDGAYAIAVSIQLDAFERRTVGLYDLIGEEWGWTNALPWPDTHEQPHVFGRHLVLRFVKNAARFALEVGADGKIVSLDKLGNSAFVTLPPIPSSPLFPGHPVAAKNGVFFTSDMSSGTLFGYAQEPLPGLRYAGKGDVNTIFSGNGLLKFTAAEGRVTVADSLTQTVLQRIDAWPHSTNTFVTGTLTTHDGSRLTVFLKTEFAGAPPVTRDWSVALDLYTGTTVKSFNADALFAKPKRSASLQALSPDGRWQLSVNASNELTIASLSQKRDVARVSLAALGLQKPIDHLAFLEQGRYITLRQRDTFWLLDFAVARGYGDLSARKAASTNAAPCAVNNLTNPPPASATGDSPDAQLATSPQGYGVSAPFDADVLSYASDPDATVPSYLALRAELFAANQAWGYSASLLEQTHRLQEYDVRAPRVNPLLLSRYQLLCGQPQKARLTCREALRTLMYDSTDYNRMVRYHLQGLLFATP